MENLAFEGVGSGGRGVMSGGGAICIYCRFHRLPHGWQNAASASLWRVVGKEDSRGTDYDLLIEGSESPFGRLVHQLI